LSAIWSWRVGRYALFLFLYVEERLRSFFDQTASTIPILLFKAMGNYSIDHVTELDDVKRF
jgi:hypothetical protein